MTFVRNHPWITLNVAFALMMAIGLAFSVEAFVIVLVLWILVVIGPSGFVGDER